MRERVRVTVDCGPGRTKQAAKDECNINTIMAKYQRTGQLPDMIRKDARYGDFSAAVDYREALNRVLLAQEQFQGLPAKVRSRFQNDPAQFLAFVEDEANADELVKMDLAARGETTRQEGSGGVSGQASGGDPAVSPGSAGAPEGATSK